MLRLTVHGWVDVSALWSMLAGGVLGLLYVACCALRMNPRHRSSPRMDKVTACRIPQSPRVLRCSRLAGVSPGSPHAPP
ncbi:hypothetical protein DFP72DRAFT_887309 [Ephemerocybe angulata]|uniref:Uncharacterized protein n=1 Tax=Ephemerocybe angulata TaxID=980116 RepID=A0A8H6I492_9AGAR|nr:hypothetical protein DFP72DRAFT_887309 [Tulosesus angulatus]